jgi:hypothetical protein
MHHHVVEGQKEGRGPKPFFYNGINTTGVAEPLWSNYLLKVLLLNYVTMPVELQHEFWRGQTFKP